MWGAASCYNDLIIWSSQAHSDTSGRVLFWQACCIRIRRLSRLITRACRSQSFIDFCVWRDSRAIEESKGWLFLLRLVVLGSSGSTNFKLSLCLSSPLVIRLVINHQSSWIEFLLLKGIIGCTWMRNCHLVINMIKGLIIDKGEHLC